ncbi:Arginine ABC transporter permease protein ArtQ [Serratia symbiotica]|nr:Arginine ABC transporter permease protein ArtQ [Serratia symbiotica]
MNYIHSLINATTMTISLAFFSLLLGLILAILFTIGESSSWKLVSWFSTIWMTLLRGLPEILLLFLIYFGSSQLLLILSDGFILNLGLCQLPIKLTIDTLEISPFFCGVITLALLYSAYASQTLRGALKVVAEGQWESGHALGISHIAIFFHLIIPQMWRHAMPGLGNQWLVLLKDTALVSLISVNDLMLQTKTIAVRTQEPFTWYMIAAGIYLFLTLLSQYMIKRIELHTTRFERFVI